MIVITCNINEEFCIYIWEREREREGERKKGGNKYTVFLLHMQSEQHIFQFHVSQFRIAQLEICRFKSTLAKT